MSYVGKDVPHDSAWGHVTGQSVYVDDMPPMHRELLVDFVPSPVAHGRIRSMDVSEAAAHAGVAGVYTFKDLHANRLGPITNDEPLLAEDEVMYVGQPIAVIAAETRAALKAAKALVRLDIEPLPALLSIEAAVEAGSFLGDTKILERGDVDAAFKKADHVLEGAFVCGGQDHFYLESQAAIAVPGEGGSLTLHSSTQHPTEVQDTVAHLLGLGANQVVCVTKRMGGGFGGKESQATQPAVMAALVAHKLNRPSRVAYGKDEDMACTGKRHPFHNRWRVAFDRRGRILALDADLRSDGGAYVDLSPAVMARAMTHIDNAYYLPAARIRGTVCRTHTPPNTAFRGFGGPQGAATIECAMEEIALHLGLDALDVRRANIYRTGSRDVTPYGQIVENNTLPRLFDGIEERSDYRKRMEAVKDFNARSKTHLKGLSLSAVKFGISFNTKHLNQGNALVNVYLDGTVQVSTGATEMGQGVNTKIRQLVADAFGIALETVRVMPTSTEKNNNTSATAASSGADLNGSAALDACSRIRARLAEVAAHAIAAQEPDIQPSPERIVFEGGHVWDRRRPHARLTWPALVRLGHLGRVSMGERGFYATRGIDWNAALHSGHPFLYFTMGCAASEVLIDRFTGELKVLRADILMDIGRPINPGIDRGQITGGFIQGMGWLTAEELRLSPVGELLTHSPTTYKIPNILDVPETFNVDWIDNDTNDVNLMKSKSTGEPPLLMAISVWTAVKHALSFASPYAAASLRAPATNEEILTRLSEVMPERPVRMEMAASRS